MIRKKKLYSRPTKPFEKTRIEEENILVKKYGLKNKKEIWKALAKINYFRKRAMVLAEAPLEEQEVFFNKLNNLGFGINSIADVLDLNVESLLKRRLPSIVTKQGLANSQKHARQLVAHKNVAIGERIINSPSYIVSVDEENRINIKSRLNKSNTQTEIKNEEVPQNE